MRNLRYLFIFIIAISLLALSAGCKNETPAFQVNDLASDPAAFSGPLTVVGIAYGYSKSDATIVGIMDKKELQCTTPNCNKVLLPVKIAGTRPAIGDEVKISGSFSREPGGYLFRAEKMEVVANHKLGGQG
jgi:hypothetical protein